MDSYENFTKNYALGVAGTSKASHQDEGIKQEFYKVACLAHYQIWEEKRLR
jgi:hypothetical protein